LLGHNRCDRNIFLRIRNASLDKDRVGNLKSCGDALYQGGPAVRKLLYVAVIGSVAVAPFQAQASGLGVLITGGILGGLAGSAYVSGAAATANSVGAAITAAAASVPAAASGTAAVVAAASTPVLVGVAVGGVGAYFLYSLVN
jgi:hypothetical protein